jgi:putative ABC transport system ATP-binding protein
MSLWDDTVSVPRLSAREVILQRDGKPFARLPDIDLSTRQTIALTGASGSGKTTALLALAGVHPPRSGDVRIDGVDPWALTAAQRDRLRGRSIGMVFQTFHLIDAVSVETNLMLAASVVGLRPDRAHISSVIDALDITAIRRRRPDQLSQGQAQRVAVARALVNRPAVVIADEPTSALDDGNARSLLRLLADVVRSSDAALLVATHDHRVLDQIEHHCAMAAAP